MSRFASLVVALLVAWLAAGQVAAGADLPTFQRFTPYPQFRATLLKQGFRPVVAPYPPPTRCDEWARFCAIYPEFLQCYVTIWTPCEFLWRSPTGALLALQTTMGPEAPKVWNLLVDRIRPMDPNRRHDVFTPRPRLPRFRMHTAYNDVRKRLIASGYRPYPVKVRDPDDGDCVNYGHLCATNPEIIHCIPTGAGFCTWLFRRNADGRFVIVETDGEPPQMRFDDIWLAERGELKAALRAPTGIRRAKKR